MCLLFRQLHIDMLCLFIKTEALYTERPQADLQQSEAIMVKQFLYLLAYAGSMEHG